MPIRKSDRTVTQTDRQESNRQAVRESGRIRQSGNLTHKQSKSKTDRHSRKSDSVTPSGPSGSQKGSCG